MAHSEVSLEIPWHHWIRKQFLLEISLLKVAVFASPPQQCLSVPQRKGKIIISKYSLPHALSFFSESEGLSALLSDFPMDLSLQLFSTL